jgi:hypothetical protein
MCGVNQGHGHGATNSVPPAQASGQIVEGKHFYSGERVITANNTYIKCIFEGSTIVFTNADFVFSPDCEFLKCKWEITFDAVIENAEAKEFDRLCDIEALILNSEFQDPQVLVVLPGKPREIRLGVRYKRNISFGIQRRIVGQPNWSDIGAGGLFLPIAQPPNDLAGTRIFTDQLLQPRTRYEYRVRGYDGNGHATGWSPVRSAETLP